MTFILSALCAASINASAVRMDNVDMYVENGVKVEAVKQNTVYIIDGKKSSMEDLNKIKPEAIESMTVYKPGSKEAVSLSGQKDVSVIKIETKKENTVYIIDGKKGVREDLNKIKPETIKSMTVYKPGSKEAVSLSGQKDASVVKVETKR